MLFFTQKGKVFWMRVYEIPEGGKNTKGRAIQNIINIESDDKVKAFLVTQDLKDEEYVNSHYVIMATKKGQVKKTSLEQYSRPRANGINATWCRRNHQCVFIPRTPLQKRCSLCPSRHTARTMGRGKKPLLVLRHYMTKSFEEYSRKMAFYQSSYKVVEESTRYAKDKWLKIFSMMNGTNYFRLKSHCVEEPTNWTNYHPVVEAHLAELFAKEARSRSNTGCRGSRSASSNHGTALGNWWPV